VTAISVQTAELLGIEGLGDVVEFKEVARLCDVIRKDIGIEEFRLAAGVPPGVASDVLATQLNRLSDQSLDTLRGLYATGATAPQVSALLASEPDGAALMAKLGRLTDHSPATLLQLYTDGADSHQIDILMASELDGALLHAVLDGRGPLGVVNVIDLYSACPSGGLCNSFSVKLIA